jgi:hypothetical protein
MKRTSLVYYEASDTVLKWKVASFIWCVRVKNSIVKFDTAEANQAQVKKRGIPYREVPNPTFFYFSCKARLPLILAQWFLVFAKF